MATLFKDIESVGISGGTFCQTSNNQQSYYDNTLVQHQHDHSVLQGNIYNIHVSPATHSRGSSTRHDHSADRVPPFWSPTRRPGNSPFLARPTSFNVVRMESPSANSGQAAAGIESVNQSLMLPLRLPYSEWYMQSTYPIFIPDTFSWPCYPFHSFPLAHAINPLYFAWLLTSTPSPFFPIFGLFGSLPHVGLQESPHNHKRRRKMRKKKKEQWRK